MSLSSFAKHAPEICTQNTFCPNHNYCVSQGFGVMIIVRSKKCVSDECPKKPSYGVAGSRKAEYCAQHALEGMVGVYLKKCVPKLPTYGISGSRKAEYCAQHALEGMVDVHSKKCVHDGCFKRPSYGISGSRKTEYCAQHALEGMFNVRSKKCARDACSKRPSYGISGSRKAEYCAQHGLEGMVRVSSKICADQGPSIMPSYGVSGSRKAHTWAEHELEGLVTDYSQKWTSKRCLQNQGGGGKSEIDYKRVLGGDSNKSSEEKPCGDFPGTRKRNIVEGYLTLPSQQTKCKKRLSKTGGVSFEGEASSEADMVKVEVSLSKH